jgi:hypothetical protein
MVLIQTEQSYFFSSDEKIGALNKELQGSSFEVKLKSPIKIPPGAVDATIECMAANVWNNSPNIAVEYENNHFYWDYAYTTTSNFVITSNFASYDFLIPDGLYGVNTLNAEIQRQLKAEDIPGQNAGTKFAETSIVLSANEASQRVVISMAEHIGFITDTDTYVNNVAVTMGFTTGASFIPTHEGHSFIADNVAQFNRINSYLLHGNLIQEGISINNSYDSILAEIQISVKPGSLIAYRPFIPYRVSAKHLKYGGEDLLRWRLTDDLNRPVNMFGENWTFTIVVRYKIEDQNIMMQGQIPHISHN